MRFKPVGEDFDSLLFICRFTLHTVHIVLRPQIQFDIENYTDCSTDSSFPHEGEVVALIFDPVCKTLC